jgi:hypothetical protein
VQSTYDKHRSYSIAFVCLSFEHEKYSVNLSELTPINTTILHVHAYDADSDRNGRVTYEFTDASKQFERIFSIDHRTGRVYLRSTLDYEEHASYLFYLQASDDGQDKRSSQTLINITLVDENDSYPQIDFRFLSEMTSNVHMDQLELSESYSIDKFFVQIVVTDRDSQLNGQVRLWFHSNNDTSFDLYRIDQSTYVFNRSVPFDYETQSFYTFVFIAEDSHPRQPLRTNRTLAIRIHDENDHAPRFLQTFYHLSIKENNPVNTTLTRIEAFDPDSDENGRVTYSLIANETYLPFHIDSRTGVIICLQTFDREQRVDYRFEIVARDHGYPTSLSSTMPIRVTIDDVNDHRPRFEHEHYEFFIEENAQRSTVIGRVRAVDSDSDVQLIYRLNTSQTFDINQHGDIYLRASIDREQNEQHRFQVLVFDHDYQRSASVIVHIVDINDCQPQWRVPSDNHTIIVINRDRTVLNTTILHLNAIDRDDPNNGNGLVSYAMTTNYDFLDLLINGELKMRSLPIIGQYLVCAQAHDHGRSKQYTSTIEFYLFVGDNQTNASVIEPNEFYSITQLSLTKRFLLLTVLFISLTCLLVFIVCLVLVLICRYRKQTYIHYTPCQESNIIVNGNQSTDYNGDTSKLSLVRKQSIVINSNYLIDTFFQE